jgi:hypothetical protein
MVAKSRNKNLALMVLAQRFIHGESREGLRCIVVIIAKNGIMRQQASLYMT